MEQLWEDGPGVALGGVVPGPPTSANGFAPPSAQRGNPVLRFVCNVPWEFGDVLPN